MVLKTFDTTGLDSIVPEPLTPENFAPYGGVHSADHQVKLVALSSANYGTATKIHKVSPVVNNFDKCPSGEPATANWNIFRCLAPKHQFSQSDLDGKIYTGTVLERHPYSTQSFIPMGQCRNEDSYVVIVASNSSDGLADPSSIKAFMCKGNQAVTYAAGTWHAPMVVIDETVPHIDFAVLIHENGVADEDCQECYFEPGFKVGCATPIE